jgi:epoxyqueuosine reductase
MVAESLTAMIRRRGRELGFVKVGIAPAEALVDEGRKLRKWIDNGNHGIMEWMAKNVDRRTDPRLVLPEARSVVCVAMNYYHDVSHSDDLSKGKISRYAWGDDYHIVMGNRLEQLRKEIVAFDAGVHATCYVDTGPVMEKAWAQRAGIGWIGKHSNVITEEVGSWVFLGEILLDAVLEYDIPATDQCGSCTLCLQACPTEAITEPYVVDARKCISYLTIEYRGPIEATAAGTFERWIYGCDICQDVCPWNLRDAKVSDRPEFRPREANIAPSLAEISGLKEQEYQERFRHSPVKRTKLSGLRRNAEAVLANQNDSAVTKERENDVKRKPS